MKTLIFALIGSLALTGCLENSDDKQNVQQEELSMRSVEAIGLPGITKFQEKRTLKQILELRDQEIATYSYTQDMNGRLHLLCKSIGYGIPYATQYTNPMHRWSNTSITLPQADPNGLFSPSSADGTWVLCLNPETKHMSPVLVEPRIIVSPFELNKFNGE
jgi:hypothetical protein